MTERKTHAENAAGRAISKRCKAHVAGFAAYLLAAIAFVDPAMAGECEDAVALLAEAELSAEQVHHIEASAERALTSKADGDQHGFLSHLAQIRTMLGQG